MRVTIDAETKSYADLRQVGAWAYSEHPTTEIICICYCSDDGEVQDWWPGKNGTNDMPAALSDAVINGAEFEAHNVSFELSIWLNILAKRYGWRVPKLTQWRDTMAVACYYAFPAQLDRLARVLGLGGKDPDGARLITKYSKLYLKTAKAEIPAVDFQKFVGYCRKDVELERQVSDILGPLPDAELEVFALDLETNLRGLFLDEAGIAAAAAIVDGREKTLSGEFRNLVGCNPTQNAKALAWFHGNGLKLDNLQADYLGDMLEDGDIPSGPCRRALEIRLAINKASTKKLDAMARNRGSDGRAHFQTRYHGAATGRTTGTGFQPLNLIRGYEDMDPDQLVRDIMLGDAEWLDTIYGDAMDAVSKAGRYWIRAQADTRIMAGDFSSIESVILACGAGETWKIEAHRAKKPIYELTADKIFGWPEGTCTKKMPERQVGKRGELAFGYQGALGAWLKFDPHPIYTDEQIIGFCRGWRKEHPETQNFWRNMESAAVEAVSHPGIESKVPGPANCTFLCEPGFLSMQLPNGKCIWYVQPEIRAVMPPRHQPAQKPECAEGTCECRPRPQVTYMAMKEGQWKRVSSYGGKFVENWTQATSREILEVAKRRAARAGYPPILTVYDEIVAEVPNSFGSAKEFEEIMCAPVDWAPGWPVRAAVWEGSRYKK